MDMACTLARPPQSKILKETRKKAAKEEKIFFVFTSINEFQVTNFDKNPLNGEVLTGLFEDS